MVKVKLITNWMRRKQTLEFMRESGHHLVIEKSVKFGFNPNRTPRTIRMFKFVEIVKGYTLETTQLISKKEIHDIGE